LDAAASALAAEGSSMKSFGAFAFIAAMASATLASSPATSITNDDPNTPSGIDFFPKQKRGKGQNNRRGKGKRSPPKGRPNRLTISKRVRRKHRKAA
jgi:hypothetical protein